jgi:hypothetical protein
MNVWRDISEIAFALIGVAAVALLVNRAQDASLLISTAGSTFDGLLRTVTLQNGYGNFAMSNRL